MKARLMVLLGLGAMAGLGHLSAQIELVILEKVINHRQIGDATVELRTPNAPYQFRMFVEGNNLSGLTPVGFSVPPTANYPIPSDATPYQLIYQSDDDEWTRTYNFLTQYSPTGGPNDGPSGLDGIFPNGAYAITAGTSVFPLTLGGAGLSDLYANVPVFTLDAGTWQTSVPQTLLLPVSQPLTITSNTFTGYYTNGYVNHISLNLYNANGDLLNLRSFSNDTVPFFSPGDFTTDFLTHTLPAYSLINGQTYVLEIEFITLADMITVDDAMGLAIFTTRTQMRIEAIPEPAGAAWGLAMMALAGAALRRRRRA